MSCHGAKGKGDGAAAAALNPKPADWTSKQVQDESDGEIFWKISTGRGAMPSWRHLPENDRWARRPLHPHARREVTGGPAVSCESGAR